MAVQGCRPASCPRTISKKQCAPRQAIPCAAQKGCGLFQKKLLGMRAHVLACCHLHCRVSGVCMHSQLAGRSKADTGPGRRAYYMLFVLLLAYTSNFIDRMIIGVIAEPLKHELKVDDWQIGLLGGLAFAIFYTGLGIPIARLAERHSRVKIIGWSLVIWSGLTAISGLVQN